MVQLITLATGTHCVAYHSRPCSQTRRGRPEWPYFGPRCRTVVRHVAGVAHGCAEETNPPVVPPSGARGQPSKDEPLLFYARAIQSRIGRELADLVHLRSVQRVNSAHFRNSKPASSRRRLFISPAYLKTWLFGPSKVPSSAML